MIACALVLLGGLAVFTVACRVAATDCWDARTARRITAWRRAGPWLAVLCAATVLTGLWL